MSCPDAVPSQQNGARIASAVASETRPAPSHARKPALLNAPSGLGELSVIPRLSLLQLVRQIDNLANMVIGVSGGAQKNIETFFRFRLAFCGIPFQPVFRFLFPNCFHDHRYRSVKR